MRGTEYLPGGSFSGFHNKAIHGRSEYKITAKLITLMRVAWERAKPKTA